MNGRSHATMGAVGWLAGTWSGILPHQTGPQTALGAVLCAGAALLPDLDMSGRVTTNQGGATIGRIAGAVSLFAAEVVEKVSLFAYCLTASKYDGRRENGHRTLTHTAAMTAVASWGAYAACAGSKLGTLIVAWVVLSGALRVALGAPGSLGGWLFMTACAGALACAVWPILGRDGHAVGLAVGVGWMIHLIGDMATTEGCPLLWPLPLRGRRWKRVGLPGWLAVRTGGVGEAVMIAAVIAAGIWLLLSHAGVLAALGARR